MAKQGFTLVELMVVLAIIGILAVMAVPQYMQYTRKAAYTELKYAAAPIKQAVELCYQRNGGPGESVGGGALCNTTQSSGSHSAITMAQLERAAAAALVASVTLRDQKGQPVITVTPNPRASHANGILASDAYTLTGSVRDNMLHSWVEGGAGCDNGYC